MKSPGWTLFPALGCPTPAGSSAALAVVHAAVKAPRILIIMALATIAVVVSFSGCVLPYSEAGTTVFARISSSGRTNEYIVVVNRQHGWINLTTPEGPQYLSTSATKRHYYFYNRRWSGKSLSFLQGNDGVDWEVLEPIEDTSSWVRVEARGRRCPLAGTNIVITLFTPRELLNQDQNWRSIARSPTVLDNP
jgi:hypothetical protein